MTIRSSQYQTLITLNDVNYSGKNPYLSPHDPKISTSKAPPEDLRAATISSLRPGVLQLETNQAADGRVLLTCKKCCHLRILFYLLHPELLPYHELFSVFPAEISNFHLDFVISEVFFGDDFAVGHGNVRVHAVGHGPVEEIVPL